VGTGEKFPFARVLVDFKQPQVAVARCSRYSYYVSHPPTTTPS